jgi:arginine decarboxylase
MASSRAARTRAATAAIDDTPPQAFLPTRVFFVSGTGTHELERVALQHAMRDAGVADSNLVKVSSVIAPGCRIISEQEGRALLRPGNIVHAVIAEAQTQEPHQRVATALAWAVPERKGLPGYIAELEEQMAMGKSEQTATEQVGEEVLEIMAMRLNAKIDAKALWAKRGRSRTVRIGGVSVRVGSVSVSCVGPEERNGKQMTAAAFIAAIYL